MLDKIEAAYLALMRVIILVAATAALAAAVVGLVTAAPMIARQLGTHTTGQVQGADLASYIDAERGGGVPTVVDPGSGAPVTRIIPGELAKAANLIAAYARDRAHERLDVPTLELALADKHAQIDPAYQKAYDESVLVLANDLSMSAGAALSTDRIDQLIEWHFSKFADGITHNTTRIALKNARGLIGLYVTAGSLACFILVLFFFLFVKIERNLRIVRTKPITT